MSQILRGTIIFTLIEEVTLVVWGLLLDLGKGLSLNQQILAAAVLLVGLFLEHLVSVNVGRKRPLLDISD